MKEKRVSEVQVVFKELKDTLKKRGHDFKKEEFDSEILSLLTNSIKEEILHKYSPDSYLVNEKMKEDEEFRSKVLSLLEGERDQTL